MPTVTCDHWDHIADQPDAPGRKIMEGKGAFLKRIAVPAGTSVPGHSHAFEQFVQVLEGTGRLECEAGDIVLRPGTVLHLQPHAWHSASFDTDTVLLEVNLAPPD